MMSVTLIIPATSFLFRLITIIAVKVLLDLVQGEFMQMGAKEDESERFSHYIHKSFKKTASLIAYTCKAVALLSGANQSFQEAAFQYGRNLGIAFQLVDDLLDFVSSQAELGKPAATDLKLGLATAPVLFACEKFPELNVMIMRRFGEPGDVERAYDFVMKVRPVFSYQLLMIVLIICYRAMVWTTQEFLRESTRMKPYVIFRHSHNL